mgnify:CR=1 FL=1
MMIQILLLITAIIFCIIIYALFAPLLLEIDTSNYVYQFRIVPIFKMWWVKDELFGHPEMSVFGINKKLQFSDYKKKSTTLKTKKTTHLKLNVKCLFSIIKTFKIKKCTVSIDTGNMPLNGMLFPFMYLTSSLTGKTFHINFTGQNEVVLTIKNNAFSILRAYIINK